MPSTPNAASASPAARTSTVFDPPEITKPGISDSAPVPAVARVATLASRDVAATSTTSVATALVMLPVALVSVTE